MPRKKREFQAASSRLKFPLLVPVLHDYLKAIPRSSLLSRPPRENSPDKHHWSGKSKVLPAIKIKKSELNKSYNPVLTKSFITKSPITFPSSTTGISPIFLGKFWKYSKASTAIRNGSIVVTPVLMMS